MSAAVSAARFVQVDGASCLPFRRVARSRRLREYGLPREFARMQTVDYPGSLLAKTLIIHNEPSGRINVILVPETLGY